MSTSSHAHNCKSWFKIPVLKKFCFCAISLRIGVYFIGYSYLVFSVNGVWWAAQSMYNLKHKGNIKSNPLGDHLYQMFLVTMLVYHIWGCISNTLLVCGAHFKKPAFLQVYWISCAIGIFSALGFLSVVVFMRVTILELFLILLMTGFNTYLLIVVRSASIEMSEEIEAHYKYKSWSFFNMPQSAPLTSEVEAPPDYSSEDPSHIIQGGPKTDNTTENITRV